MGKNDLYWILKPLSQWSRTTNLSETGYVFKYFPISFSQIVYVVTTGSLEPSNDLNTFMQITNISSYIQLNGITVGNTYITTPEPQYSNMPILYMALGI